MEEEGQQEQNGEDNGTNGNVDSLDKDSEKKADDEEVEEEEEEEEEEDAGGLVTKEQCEMLAEKLGSEWKKLATELNFPEDDVTFLEGETEDVTVQALKMLILWQVRGEVNKNICNTS